jgi:S-adenosylmethionine:tRNA ribosyltransferase-isomerase
VNALALPEAREAHEPAEARGRGRDDVALLVADAGTGSLGHARFPELPRFLRPGDLLVVNTSATLPAAVRARLDGRPVELRLSTPAAPGAWVVEVRGEGGEPHEAPPAGTRLDLPGGAHAEVVAPFADSRRLSIARLELGTPLHAYLRSHGRPIRYGYVPRDWPLEAYQTVFARHPGSAEMPSAGRPFTAALVTELAVRGVLIAPVTLHTGVSSPELGEPPYEERFHVPAATARVANAVHGWGGRVVAVGTTVVRALETVARADGTVAPGSGSTGLVVTPRTGTRAVDGLLTGWHEPRSTHLQLLEAIGGAELIARSYHEARSHGYRRHEFGDLHLILSRARPAGAAAGEAA